MDSVEIKMSDGDYRGFTDRANARGSNEAIRELEESVRSEVKRTGKAHIFLTPYGSEITIVEPEEETR